MLLNSVVMKVEGVLLVRLSFELLFLLLTLELEKKSCSCIYWLFLMVMSILLVSFKAFTTLALDVYSSY